MPLRTTTLAVLRTDSSVHADMMDQSIANLQAAHRDKSRFDAYHKVCGLGHYEHFDLMCAACPVGTYKDTVGGTYHSVQDCLPCPAGTGTDQTGQSACEPCV